MKLLVPAPKRDGTIVQGFYSIEEIRNTAQMVFGFWRQPTRPGRSPLRTPCGQDS